jgi:hypothetical protein
MTVYSYGIMGEFRCEKSGGQSLRTVDIKRAIWKKMGISRVGTNDVGTCVAGASLLV